VVDFGDLLGDVVEEVLVVCYGEDGVWVGCEVLFELLYVFGV